VEDTQLESPGVRSTSFFYYYFFYFICICKQCELSCKVDEMQMDWRDKAPGETRLA